MTPEGWSRRRLGEIATVVGGATPRRDQPSNWGGAIPWATPTDVTSLPTRFIDKTAETITEEGLASSAANLLPAGALLMTSRATIGACAIARVPLATNQGFQNLVPDPETDSEFLLYALKQSTPRLVRIAAGSTFLEVSRSAVRALEIDLPPLPEQRKIAAILASVDETLEETESVIARLQDLKQAMMQELLTRGLPGRHTQSKPTKIGRLPVTWDVRLGQDLFSLGSGYGPADIRFSLHGEALFIKVDDFNAVSNRRWIVASALRFKRVDNPSIRTYSPGSIVFPKRGAAIFKSRVRRLKYTSTVDPNIMVLEPRSCLDNEFFFYSLSWLGLHRFADNSGVPQINNKHLYPHAFAVPPLVEQQEIAIRLRAVDDSLETEQSVFKRLTTLKSALQHALLTGAVRVTPDSSS